MVTAWKREGGIRTRLNRSPLSLEPGMSSVPESEGRAGPSGCVGREVPSSVAWGLPGSASGKALPTAGRRHCQGGRTGLRVQAERPSREEELEENTELDSS